MKKPFLHTEFYKELEVLLPTSTGAIRQAWVGAIIEKGIAIKDLSGLLHAEPKTATRFLWLLSEIGIANPDTLFRELPFLLEACQGLNPVYKTSFANYWLIAGVPPENEGTATDMLFQWVVSPHINTTIKSRALLVLFNLTKKYPELKNELKLCLEDQMDRHSLDFKKRASKILMALEP